MSKSKGTPKSGSPKIVTGGATTVRAGKTKSKKSGQRSR